MEAWQCAMDIEYFVQNLGLEGAGGAGTNADEEEDESGSSDQMTFCRFFYDTYLIFDTRFILF